MFHIRRYSSVVSTVATYPDEPATPETFVANVQQILLEPEQEHVNKRAVIETMVELSRELRND